MEIHYPFKIKNYKNHDDQIQSTYCIYVAKHPFLQIYF